MTAETTEVRSRGVVTIPKAIRDSNRIQEGQRYTVHDLGKGNLLLSPRESQIHSMCDTLRERLEANGATLELMLEELRKYREANSE